MCVYHLSFQCLRLCILLLLLLLLLITAIEFSLSGSSPYTQMKQYKNTVDTSTHITKTPTRYKSHTYTHPDIAKPMHIHTLTYYKTS